jgi:DNA-binding transcriptional regulator YhcF (GntR family)
MADTVKITFDAVRRARDEKELSWREIGDKWNVSPSTVMRIYESEEDHTVQRRKKKPKAKLGTVNRALKAAADDTDRMQAKLASLFKDLRKRGVSTVAIDVESNEAKLTYTQTRTVKVSP